MPTTHYSPTHHSRDRREQTMGVIAGGQVLPGRVRAYTQFEMDALATKRLGGAPTGATGDRNYFLVPGGLQGDGLPPVFLEGHVKGTQTILAPSMGTNGWDIGQDQTAADGYEYVIGGNTARNPYACVVGTD